jgi:ABC-2 type transport system permease protein
MSPLRSLLLARVRTLVHALAAVRRESRLKVGFVAVTLVLLWIGMFALAQLGLGWLERFGSEALGGAALALAPLLVPRLLAVSALVLLVMLVLSSTLLALALLFRSPETAQLLTRPLPVRELALVRLVDVAFFSSWSSAYVGSPLLLAYALASHAAWWFYPLAAALWLPFVVIPAALGTLATLALVRVVPRLPRAALVAACVALAGAVFLLFRAHLASSALEGEAAVASLVELAAGAQGPWWPSAWLVDGLVAASGGHAAAAVFPFFLLLANALLLAWLAGEAAQRWLAHGFSNLASVTHARRAAADGPRLLAAVTRPLHEPARSLTLKDLRTFSRDFSQWSQAALFFGVLVLYVANLHATAQGFSAALWQRLITSLNTTACLLVLATLTTRFVFPLVSLEGRRIWLLSLAPLRVGAIVRQKFWLSVAASATVTAALMTISGWKLRLAPAPFAISLATVLAASAALSGVAVGLGSLFPDFTADSPARIVSGTGGTLTFIVSIAYVGLVAATQGPLLRWASGASSARHPATGWLALAMAGVIVACSLAAVAVPLRLGIAKLERTEF